MTNAIRTLGRVEWQAALLLAVVFGAGVAVGAALDHSRALPMAPPPAGAPVGPAGGRPGRLPPYLETMGLTQDQHAKIKAILDAQRPKVDTVMAGVLPRLQALSDTTFAQIRGVLTPDQQTQFDRERPRRELAPGMPGAPGGRGGRGPPPEGPPGGPPEGRGPPPPRDGRGPPPRDGRGPPPDGRGPPADGRGPPPPQRPAL
jgi:Spy/CpxP family protein refolding chaperone